MEGVIRTRVGYAGGVTDNPAYYNIGNHSESIQIDYDPDIVSYRELLDVFWDSNAAVALPYSMQYHSRIFFHNEEQKVLAEESYRIQKKEHPGTVATEIIPYKVFYIAEDYHQKFYLRQDRKLMAALKDSILNDEKFINSTAVARLNGYAGGNGSSEILERDIDRYGLTEEGKKRLLEVADKGLSPVCGVVPVVPE
ncbi:MAG: peptide-methionine (S)-S-oxide reductase [Dehalococcoidales bacterium]|nr:peptide-methionine (S)-S-oxide reductase [Dehalococcoidales bacterium]